MPEDAQRLIERYVEHYNTVRLHCAIGFVPSADYGSLRKGFSNSAHS